MKKAHRHDELYVKLPIVQPLAPCICRLLCGRRGCPSRTLYGAPIVAILPPPVKRFYLSFLFAFCCTKLILYDNKIEIYYKYTRSKNPDSDDQGFSYQPGSTHSCFVEVVRLAFQRSGRACSRKRSVQCDHRSQHRKAMTQIDRPICAFKSCCEKSENPTK